MQSAELSNHPSNARYSPGTVGSIMDPHYLSFRETQTVREAIEMIRFLSNNGVPLLYAYAVDDEFRLKGVLIMRDLLVAADDTLIGDIMKKDIYAINVNRNKDEVAKEAIEKRYLAVPIVDDEGHLLGALKFGDIIHFAQEESSKDIQKLFGAGAEETAASPVAMKIAKRLPWLQINLATAFLAAAIIGMFEGMIAKITVLAAYLPIIAGQGGNTGAQSLAVVMRGLALNEIDKHDALKVVRREVAAGLVNGIAVGVVTGFACWIFNHNAWLGLVVGTAMVGNMIIAAFCGAVIPLIMKKAGMDPAQCSSIILTTFTDVFGFLILLSLASVFQALLI